MIYIVFIFYFLDDLKNDSHLKTYLDHLGMCTAEELSKYL